MAAKGTKGTRSRQRLAAAVGATKSAIPLRSETGLVGVRVRCPVSSQCDSEVHHRGVQGTEGGSGRKHKRKVTAACNPGTGTRRRREARQERSDGERRSTPGGQPPGRVHMETGRWPCHHNLSYRSGSKVACGARRAPQEAGRKAIGLKSKLGLDIGHGERMQRQGMRTAGPAERKGRHRRKEGEQEQTARRRRRVVATDAQRGTSRERDKQRSSFTGPISHTHRS